MAWLGFDNHVITTETKQYGLKSMKDILEWIYTSNFPGHKNLNLFLTAKKLPLVKINTNTHHVALSADMSRSFQWNKPNLASNNIQLYYHELKYKIIVLLQSKLEID